MTNSATMTPDDMVTGVESLLDALADARRRRAALDAEETLLLATAVDLARGHEDAQTVSQSGDIGVRSLAAQIGTVLRVSDRTVQRNMSDAAVMVGSFPATLTSLGAAEISRAHVRVIVEAGLGIDDDRIRAAFEAAALDVARRETPGRLRPAARLLAARLHPVPLETRHADAARGRDVWVRDLDDGMAELIATLPAAIAHGIRDRLNTLARREIDARGRGDGECRNESHHKAECAAPPDTRRIGEVRADMFADLLLTGHATAEISHASIPEQEAIVARVHITVPALTMLGADTTPAELVGHAPIDLDTARRLAATAPGWDRVLTHPVTGTVVAVDRYRPADQLKRALRVRDEHCRFPGCRMPTRRCDIDHTVAREHDGPTELTNLAYLCRRHHTLKHHSSWRVRQTPDGVLHWTSPTGRVYPDKPSRTLTFTTIDVGREELPPF